MEKIIVQSCNTNTSGLKRIFLKTVNFKAKRVYLVLKAFENSFSSHFELRLLSEDAIKFCLSEEFLKHHLIEQLFLLNYEIENIHILKEEIWTHVADKKGIKRTGFKNLTATLTEIQKLQKLFPLATFKPERHGITSPWIIQKTES